MKSYDAFLLFLFNIFRVCSLELHMYLFSAQNVRTKIMISIKQSCLFSLHVHELYIILKHDKQKMKSPHNNLVPLNSCPCKFEK